MKDLFKELDRVVLTRDLPEHHLVARDIGTIVRKYSDGLAYDVEFLTGTSDTIAVVTLSNHEVRTMESNEILHVRTLAIHK